MNVLPGCGDLGGVGVQTVDERKASPVQSSAVAFPSPHPRCTTRPPSPAATPARPSTTSDINPKAVLIVIFIVSLRVNGISRSKGNLIFRRATQGSLILDRTRELLEGVPVDRFPDSLIGKAAGFKEMETEGQVSRARLLGWIHPRTGRWLSNETSWDCMESCGSPGIRSGFRCATEGSSARPGSAKCWFRAGCRIGEGFSPEVHTPEFSRSGDAQRQGWR